LYYLTGFPKSFMPYVIATSKNNLNYCVRADSNTNTFVLIPVESDSDLAKVFCHPYRIGATQILDWINDNDSALASEELYVCDEGKFRH
jgi:hypothetical protein